jgi:hypothetical protein
MTLFRSEEHVRSWDRFAPGTDEGIVALSDLVKMFSGNYFRRRMDPDWVSRSREYAMEMVGIMGQIGLSGPFWQPVKP